MVAECSPFAREKVAALMLKKGYLRQLLDLFATCEDLDDREGLHMMYRLVRGLARGLLKTSTRPTLNRNWAVLKGR